MTRLEELRKENGEYMWKKLNHILIEKGMAKKRTCGKSRN